MKPIINPWLFYWASVSDDIKFALTILTIIAVVASLMFMLGDAISAETGTKTLVIAACMGLLAVALPSKTTVYQMAVASQITPNNLDAAKEDMQTLVDYIVDAVRQIEENDKR